MLWLSRPELLGLTTYGPNRLLVKNKIYMHYLKVSEGGPCILEFENGLSMSLIEPKHSIPEVKENTNI